LFWLETIEHPKTEKNKKVVSSCNQTQTKEPSGSFCFWGDEVFFFLDSPKQTISRVPPTENLLQKIQLKAPLTE